MLSQEIDFGREIITKELKKLNLSEDIIINLQEEAFIKLDKMLARWNMNKPFRINFCSINPVDIEKIAHSVCLEVVGAHEISTKLNILKEYIHFEDGVFYINNKSANRKIIDDKLLEVYNFSFGKFEFFEYDLRFCDCCFKSDMVELQNMQKDYSYLSFIRCKFLNPIDLPNYEKTINHIIEMKDCIFCENVVINKVFNENIYFNNSTFKKYADFHESEFNKTACFYGVTFEKTPNFSQVIFKGNLNLVNSNLNFDFDECEKTFDKELSIHEEKETDIQNLTPKLSNKAPYKIASDFRDSFRGFKNALIKDNNLLDASNYHKIELYFKEIELKHKKPKIFSKEWIDLWQLKLYRLTSNHHTDLLKILSCLVILIGIFATMLYINENLSIILSVKVMKSVFGVAIIIFLIFSYEKITFFNFLTLASCIPCFWLFWYNPKFIFGVANLFSSGSKNGLWFNVVYSIYTILFVLLIFSLQKTARRNSIIPA